jgi:hypothetical protein
VCLGINYTSWALVNWIFNGYIKKNFFAWWTKYNVSIPALSSYHLQQLTKNPVCSRRSSRYRNSCCRYRHLLRSQLSRLLDAGLVGYDGVGSLVLLMGLGLEGGLIVTGNDDQIESVVW